MTGVYIRHCAVHSLWTRTEEFGVSAPSCVIRSGTVTTTPTVRANPGTRRRQLKNISKTTTAPRSPWELPAPQIGRSAAVGGRTSVALGIPTGASALNHPKNRT
jgi:hypothetical protein